MTIETQFRDLLNTIDEGVILLDPKLKIIEMNLETWIKIGFEIHSKLIGNNLFECFPCIREIVSIEQIRSVLFSGKSLSLNKSAFVDQSRNNQFDVHIYRIGQSIAIVIKDVTFSIRRENEIDLLNRQLWELNIHLQSIREDERKIVAQNIHDELGQELTGIKFELARISKRLENDKSQFRESINSLLMEVNGAIQSVKKITAGLRPESLEFHFISEVIKQITKDLNTNKNIKTNLSITPDKIELERKLSITLYRIFQESITNIIRHSKADTVDISLNLYKEKIILNVRDNGIGIKADAIKSSDAFGLIGMHERCHSHGGEFHITGYPEKGTVLEVSIPL